MGPNKVIDHRQWIEARKQLLEKEKEFTRARDELSRARRDLPWEKVEKSYVFEGPDGKESLADLFAGRSQLIVYHFMFGPDWETGCKACSFLADHFEPAVVHLNQRDVSMVAVSRAPLAKLTAFKKRMGWTFKWVSASDGAFNRDYQVSFTQDEIDNGTSYYNYKNQKFPSTEAPGASVFFKKADGEIFHTYSVYQRGLDMFITAYHYLDMVPKGRDESSLAFTMEWLRLKDEYGG
ncbi:MAG: thioredoxin family protein [Kiloniellales bacterium]|nr:thioredoxin family protein [Kiloniellales bacterium]